MPRLVNKAFLEALAEDFRQGGPEAIAKVRKYQPAAYMKICALLVPREMKLEHSAGVKGMTTASRCDRRGARSPSYSQAHGIIEVIASKRSSGPMIGRK